MDPDKLTKVRKYEHGVYEILRQAVSDDRGEPTEKKFDQITKEIEELEAEGHIAGKQLSAIAVKTNTLNKIREEWCEELFGHEYDPDSNTCMNCYKFNDYDPEDFYPDEVY